MIINTNITSLFLLQKVLHVRFPTFLLSYFPPSALCPLVDGLMVQRGVLIISLSLKFRK